jgi:hypothetical protein
MPRGLKVGRGNRAKRSAIRWNCALVDVRSGRVFGSEQRTLLLGRFVRTRCDGPVTDQGGDGRAKSGISVPLPCICFSAAGVAGAGECQGAREQLYRQVDVLAVVVRGVAADAPVRGLNRLGPAIQVPIRVRSGGRCRGPQLSATESTSLACACFSAISR